MIEAQEHTLETPDVRKIPHPVHERELGPKDHVRNLGLRYLHCGLLVEPDIISVNIYLSSVSVLSAVVEDAVRILRR